MNRSILGFILLIAATSLLSAGPADGEVDKILTQYEKIHAALSSDSTEGVNAAARLIQQLAASIQSTDPASQELGGDLSEAAQRIQGKDLEQTRIEFFELSKPLLVYLNQSYSGEKTYYRYYCDMAKKGWVQSEKGVRNPYYGSSMLTCGELIK